MKIVQLVVVVSGVHCRAAACTPTWIRHCRLTLLSCATTLLSFVAVHICGVYAGGRSVWIKPRQLA